VTGKITSYRGRPEIVATERGQIEIQKERPTAESEVYLGVHALDWGIRIFTYLALDTCH
jgi:hypothetical protein